ncbi:calcium-binding protein [Mesorhizobium sp. M6A.T.Cr.TU.017.01.1.1]|uniref:calcium-binding protein n=1 Tax=Mesorhizobium sp. M6A.T.Cr.TU.017.01.1.1 TaxID=2496774 RepID=UPI000FD522A0|nr:calcium-binding protein [Mesorhizobium sp. M6A.T.Cr.TU.017.01.1.1]RUV00471.1 calcium-binding protein [Mesorhizobium sp. M6A.T.Cr.TU.017.01.1.1]
MALHFAAGGSATEVASAGFNLVDVQYVDQVNELPDGTKGLVWLNEGEGVTQSFIDKVTPFLGNPKVFGFFLVDEPDPTGQYHTQVDAEDLKAESDWIHSRMPEAKTFITAMDMGSAADPDFSNTYNYDNTHIDLFGIDPYPVRTGTETVDYDMIDRTVAAAVESGIPTSAIVPVYQTFGGGNYTTNTGGKYVMPTTDQLETMMDHWEQLVPNPAFDFAYAWGSQEGDTALESSPELQAVFREHNLATPTTVPDVAPPTPVPDVATPTPVPDVATPTPVPDLASPTPTPVPDGGNDDYYVDSAGDKVIESAGQGQDRVWTAVDYAISAGSSIEVLGTTEDAGTTAINLTGNELAQTIQGNAGANVINGGGGADKLNGFGGNDDYYADNAGDEVVESSGQGQDRVWTSVSYVLSAGSSIEVLGTTKDAGTTAINLTGNELAQTIQGNAGANVINGGGGADKLSGFGGNDIFVFNSALGDGNVDRITDFNPSQNKIHLDDAIFAGLKLGTLTSDAFFAGSAADDSADHIIYNSSTGALSFDSDGIGGASQTQFATLSPDLSLNAASFFVT